MIKKIDHLVITTANLAKCLNFYQQLGFKVVSDGARYALFAGDFKINVHRLGSEFAPYAQNVQTGSADLCFEITDDLAAYRAQLEAQGLSIEVGIVSRHGARGAMQSLYLRDPDGNLIELAHYLT